MELTQAQKDLNLPSKWWEDQEKQRQQIECWKAHPLSIKEISELLSSRTIAQKHNTWHKDGPNHDEINKIEK